jgi:signal transduction histidine kinase
MEQEVANGWAEGVHPDDLSRCLAVYVGAFDARRSFEMEYRLRAASGEYRWILDRGVPRHEGGRFLGYIGSCVDITERRQAEAAVTAASDEWGATFDAMDLAVLVLDANDRVHRLNSAATALAGGGGDCLGRTLGELGAGEPWRSGQQAALRAHAAGHPVGLQVRGNGQAWDVDATLARGLAGQEQRLIVTIRDVSELVRLQDSVKRSETMAAMGSLVAGVAHEVRNPLFAMSVNIDALALELGQRSEFQELLEALSVERDRINRLMEELLDFGRPASPQLVSGPLEPVLERAVASCAPLLRRHGVTIERRGGGDSLQVRMDAGRLEEVFANLIENACQHCPPGSTVQLEVDPAGSDPHRPSIRVAVRDPGPGFPEDSLHRVFEPFFTRRKGGTGLGLAIVQRFVEEHGGRVQASNAPGGGGVVVVELPVHAGH